MKYLRTLFGSAILTFVVSENIYAEDTQLLHTALRSESLEYITKIVYYLEHETVGFAYPKRESELNDDQRIALDAMVPVVNADQNIDRVVIVAWPDRLYPATADDEPLSDDDRILAKKRAENIQYYFNKQGIYNVDVFSMTERPTWVSKLFEKENPRYSDHAYTIAQIKARILNLLSSKGGPSKALVFYRRDWKYAGAAVGSTH